ncbi:MAG: hypothetical protein AVDCRST_MAG37-953, partial [uncultured Rubrobacteraceae bacterium]
ERKRDMGAEELDILPGGLLDDRPDLPLSLRRAYEDRSTSNQTSPGTQPAPHRPLASDAIPTARRETGAVRNQFGGGL